MNIELMINSEKNYITPLGYKRLTDEAEFLMQKERPKVVKIVTWAASLGDRSENADYQYGKKRLREIDKRVRFLNRRINSSEIIDPAESTFDKIKFGATVELETEEGSRKVISIVGVDEIDTGKGFLSWKSPIGKMLLGKEAGDEVVIDSPSGKKEYEIIAVSYAKIEIEEFVAIEYEQEKDV